MLRIFRITLSNDTVSKPVCRGMDGQAMKWVTLYPICISWIFISIPERDEMGVDYLPENNSAVSLFSEIANQWHQIGQLWPISIFPWWLSILFLVVLLWWSFSSLLSAKNIVFWKFTPKKHSWEGKSGLFH